MPNRESDLHNYHHKCLRQSSHEIRIPALLSQQLYSISTIANVIFLNASDAIYIYAVVLFISSLSLMNSMEFSCWSRAPSAKKPFLTDRARGCHLFFCLRLGVAADWTLVLNYLLASYVKRRKKVANGRPTIQCQRQAWLLTWCLWGLISLGQILWVGFSRHPQKNLR